MEQFHQVHRLDSETYVDSSLIIRFYGLYCIKVRALLLVVC